MPAQNNEQPIRILHLSDIHFKAGKVWDADPVLRALTRFIANEVNGGLIPDLVAITGDLVFAGTTDEYGLARDWLDQQLWPALPADLSHDRLLLVPGNHDVDRRQVGSGARLMQDGLLSNQDQDGIAALLKDDNEREVMLKRHAAYLAFLGDWRGEAQPLPWWRRSIEIRGVRLHVAGLDSAWMAYGDADRGRLLLGRYQVNQTVLHQDADNADWRLALLHHPWDYFAEFDSNEARSTIHQHRDLLLRGHLHQPQTERVVPPDPSRACLELAAGCVYENSRYPNAFQWIELHLLPRRVKVLYRAWIEGEWDIDRNRRGCPNGETKFDLPSKNQGGEGSTLIGGNPTLGNSQEFTTGNAANLGLHALTPDDHPAPAVKPASPIKNVFVDSRRSGEQLVGADFGKVKVDLCRRLGGDWQLLADYFSIEPVERARFDRGWEPQRVWEWLKARNKLDQLAEGLRYIGRDDLADLLNRPR